LENEVAKQSKAQKNCITVLNRLVKMCEEDAEFAGDFKDDLNLLLNGIQAEDGFGTEGQSDPRGDFRNGRWSMDKVEKAG
jgi:hypothetical protein